MRAAPPRILALLAAGLVAQMSTAGASVEGFGPSEAVSAGRVRLDDVSVGINASGRAAVVWSATRSWLGRWMVEARIGDRRRLGPVQRLSRNGLARGVAVGADGTVAVAYDDAGRAIAGWVERRRDGRRARIAFSPAGRSR